MSKQVDERVVSMQFDNKNFEANVATTMSTLDKFKQKLNLSGAAKGLNDVNTAAKKVDMSGLSGGIEAVHTKFSALEVMGVTALANITNSAVNAGKRIASALTIDPIKTGFQEYETQMNAVQTILANTQSKGSTLDDVNNALDTLNTYADKTIYNFTEMTRNIGTFTAAGVDLQTSVDSIQGIANLAAVSGSSSQQASTAMYQLSQALAAGKVSLMDWNSVVNAGMGGELFQNALIRTSELLKTGAKDAINTYGSFRESLTQGEWLTTEVLTETLKQLSGAYSEADLIAQGFTKEQAKEITKLAETATDAATKVKTFTQLWDVLKESAQSGWSQTWKLIVGDFEEAKALLTPLADFLTNAIGKMSDARNALIEGVMDFASPWTKITEKLNAAGLGKVKETLDAVGETTDKLKYFQDVVNDVWRGDYKNSDTGRFELLKKAGYDDRVVQDLVNKGNGYKLTVKDVEESHKKFGLTMSKTTERTKEATTQFTRLSNEQLKNAGLTENEIKLYNDLADESERTGKSIDELVDKMSKTDGRTLLIDSLKNAGSGLIGIFTAMKNAWSEIFPAPSVVRIYNIIDAINQFSENLRLTDEKTGELTETAKKLQRTFKGIFAAFDIVLTIVGGPLKIAFKAFTQLLGMFDLDILDVTASVGDAIVNFRDWLDSVLDFKAVFEKIIPPIKNAAKAIKEWFEGIKDAEDVPKYIADGLMTGLGKIGSFLAETFGNIWDFLTQGFSGAPGDLVSGFVNGIWDGIQVVGQALWEFGSQILAKLREVLGIHSPSTETFEIAKWLVLGFFEGIKAFVGFVFDLIQTFATKCLSILKELDFGKVFAVIMSGGLLIFLIKLGKALEALASPLEGLGDIFEETAGAIKSFSGVMKSLKKAIAAQALKTVAISIAILAGALVVLSFVPVDRLLIAAGVLAAIATAMIFMLKAITKLGDGADIKLAKFAALMLSMAGAIAIIAISLRILGGMDENEVLQAVGLLAVIVVAIGALMAISKLANGTSKWNPEKFGNMLIRMAGAMVILAIVMKLLGGMEWGDLVKAEIGLFSLVGVMKLLTSISKMGGKDVGESLAQMAVAMLILVIVMKLLAGMKWEDMGKAAIGLIGLVGIMALLGQISKISGKDVGKTLLQISGAMAILAITARLIAGMSWEGMAKAGVGLVALGGIITGLIAATRLAGGNDLEGVAGTLLAMSISIGILAAVAVLLSLMDMAGLAKGIIAIGLLAKIMSMMILATRFARDCKSNLIVMTVAIGVMTAAVVALSFIDPTKLAGAVIALGVLMGIFALMIKTTGSAGKAMGTLIALTLIVGALSFVLYKLSELPIESTVGAAVSLSVLLLALSGAMTILSKSTGMKVSNIAKSVLGMAMMTGVLALLGLVLAMMSALNVQNAIENALVLSGLLLVLTGVSAVLSLIGAGSTNILMGAVGLAALTGVLALLGLVLAMMSALNIQNAVENATVLSALILVLTGVAAALALLGFFSVSILAGTVCLLGLTVILALLGLVLAMMSALNIQNAMTNTIALTTLLTVMADVCYKLALVGPLALIGVVAMGALTVLMVSIGALAVAVGVLMEKFPQLQSFLDTGIPVLEQLANAVGSLLGNLVSGFLTAATDGLPEIGTTLSQFITNAMPFIEGVKLVDDSVTNGVKALASAVIALTAADLISGIGSFLSDGSSFAQLGTELSMFMTNAMPFIMGARMLNEDAIAGAKALAEMVLILTAADLLQGLTSWVTGGSSITDFATQLKPLGDAMAAFSTSVSGIDESAVTAAANAGKVMAEMASALPNSGGLAGFFAGENDMGTFGYQLVQFGLAIKSFSDTVKGGIDEEAVTAAANAGKAMSEMAATIPNTGGVLAYFTGDNDMGVFGYQLVQFGLAIKSFSDTIKGGIDEEAIEAAKKAGELMTEMQSTIVPTGGVVQFFTGEQNLETFGSQLKLFGESLTAFSGEIKENLDADAVEAAKNAGDLMVELQKALPEDGGWWDSEMSLDDFGKDLKKFGGHMAEFSEAVSGNIDSSTMNSITKTSKSMLEIQNGLPEEFNLKAFGKELKSFGGYFKEFYDGISEVDTGQVSSAISNTNKLVSMINNMAGLDASGVGAFGKALKSLGSVEVDGFVEAFSQSTSKLSTAGVDMINALIKGMSSKKSAISSTAKSITTELVKTIVSAKNVMSKSGVDLLGAFVKGVSSQKNKVKSTFTTVLSSAVTSIREKYQSFYSAGSYLVSGFASGISANTYLAEAKAKAMANAAEKAAKEALDINSPSKVFRALGYSVPEGFAMGIDRMLGLVTGSSGAMADTAINSVSSAISKVADYVNNGIDAQPTIRPVLDLSDVKSQAGSISGLFRMRPSVDVLSNVGAINSMMNSRQNGTANDVISAINGLRKSLSDSSGDQYNINGITYDDGTNVSEAVRTLVRAARIERRI